MSVYSKVFKYIPGFRSRTTWKMLIASIYYFIVFSMAAESIGHLVASISIPFIAVYFIDLLNYKRKGMAFSKAVVSAAVSLLVFFGGLMLMPLVEEDTVNYESLSQVKKEETSQSSLKVNNESRETREIKEAKETLGVKKEVKIEAKIEETKPAVKSIVNEIKQSTNTKTAISYNKGVVIRHIDGDTIVVKLLNGKEEKVRLIGIDAPEISPAEAYGKEASIYTKSKLLNKTVYLEKDTRERDSYGRLLRYAWLEVPEKINEQEIRQKMFNSILLLNGYAKQMTVLPDDKYKNYFAKYEAEAKDKKKGVWAEDKNYKVKEQKNVKQEQPEIIKNGVMIISLNLKSEEVVIKNNSDKNIDMSMWKLRSEKGAQAFFFPEGFTLKAGGEVKVCSGKYAKGDGVKSLKWTSNYVWNNKGDKALLFDRNSKLIHSK